MASCCEIKNKTKRLLETVAGASQNIFICVARTRRNNNRLSSQTDLGLSGESIIFFFYPQTSVSFVFLGRFSSSRDSWGPYQSVCSLQVSESLQEEKQAAFQLFFLVDLLHVYQSERIGALEIICLYPFTLDQQKLHALLLFQELILSARHRGAKPRPTDCQQANKIALSQSVKLGVKGLTPATFLPYPSPCAGDARSIPQALALR